MILNNFRQFYHFFKYWPQFVKALSIQLYNADKCSRLMFVGQIFHNLFFGDEERLNRNHTTILLRAWNKVPVFIIRLTLSLV